MSLAIWDAGGRRVRAIESRNERDAGAHEAEWDGRDDGGRAVAPGLYWVSLEAGGMRLARRLVRLP